MGRHRVGVYSNICVVVKYNLCMRVVLRACGKMRGSTSCKVRFSTSSQPDNNLCVCMGVRMVNSWTVVTTSS